MGPPLQSVRPPELGREISQKVKAVVVVIMVVAVSAVGLVSYYWASRTVSVTFVESGLPAGSNWSVSMFNPTQAVAQRASNSTAGNPSTITVNGLEKDTWYGVVFNYPGAYAAYAKYWGKNNSIWWEEYNKPFSFWQNPSQPIGIKTNSSSSTLKILFDPFVNVGFSLAFVHLNNQTYGMYDGGGVGAVSTSTSVPFGPQPVNDTTVVYGYEFAPGTVLQGSNGTLLNLTGSFNVTQVNLQSNVTGISIIGMNRTLPWHVYMSPVEPEIIEINVYIPHEPIIQAVLNFTLTIEGWNPNGQ